MHCLTIWVYLFLVRFILTSEWDQRFVLNWVYFSPITFIHIIFFFVWIVLHSICFFLIANLYLMGFFLFQTVTNQHSYIKVWYNFINAWVLPFYLYRKLFFLFSFRFGWFFIKYLLFVIERWEVWIVSLCSFYDIEIELIVLIILLFDHEIGE